MLIRDARADDWSAIWPFFREIVAARETYAYDPDMSPAEAERVWMVGPPAVPEAFAHPSHGYVGLHGMHRFL